MARTQSKTHTSTRIEFILNHFRTALNRLTDFDKYEIAKILDGLENEEISYLEFIGYLPRGPKNEVFVRLQLTVDWDEHHHLRSAQPKIVYDNKFEEGNCPEIYGLILLTQRTIFDKQLKSSILYGYTDKIKRNSYALSAVRKKYGTSPTSIEYDYSKLRYKESCCAPEATELSATCDLSGD